MKLDIETTQIIQSLQKQIKLLTEENQYLSDFKVSAEEESEELQKKYQKLRNLLQTVVDRVRAEYNTISLDFVEYIELVLKDHDKKN